VNEPDRQAILSEILALMLPGRESLPQPNFTAAEVADSMPEGRRCSAEAMRRRLLRLVRAGKLESAVAMVNGHSERVFWLKR
jgi:hypothetical protein